MVTLCTLHTVKTELFKTNQNKKTTTEWTNDRSPYNVWMITDACIAVDVKARMQIPIFIVNSCICCLSFELHSNFIHIIIIIILPSFFYSFYSFFFLLSEVSTGVFLKILFLRFCIYSLLWNKMKCIFKRSNNEHLTANPKL